MSQFCPPDGSSALDIGKDIKVSQQLDFRWKLHVTPPSASVKRCTVRPTNLGLRIVQHQRTVEAALRTSARLIPLEYEWYPPIRVLLPSLWENDHPPEHTCRQPLHALAVLSRWHAPDENVCERGEDVVLWRHKRDLLCAVLRERVEGMHESRLDDFLPAVGRRQAMLCHA